MSGDLLDTAVPELSPIERVIARAYREGLKKATREYAIHKDGGQWVGVMRIPLREAIAFLDGLGDRVMIYGALSVLSAEDRETVALDARIWKVAEPRKGGA